jgi:hypothetical protein
VFVPAGPHILVSSSTRDNQDRAALEAVFHEGSHPLAGKMEEVLKRASSAGGIAVPADLSHAVIFYLTGETVRRALEQAAEPYTPWLYALKLWPDDVRVALPKALSPYWTGKACWSRPSTALVQALGPAGW